MDVSKETCVRILYDGIRSENKRTSLAVICNDQQAYLILSHYWYAAVRVQRRRLKMQRSEVYIAQEQIEARGLPIEQDHDHI